MTARLAALAAILMASSPAVAQSTAGFSLREWATLTATDRQITIVGAIEGLMLASASGAPGVNADCLTAQKLDDLDQRLKAAAASADGEFVSRLLEVSKCSRS